MLDNRTESESGKKGQTTDNHDHTGHKRDEQPVIGRESAGRGGCDLLGSHRPRNGKCRNDHEEPADHHAYAQSDVPEAVGGQPGKSAAVIGGGRGIGIERLGEPVRAAGGQGRQLRE